MQLIRAAEVDGALVDVVIDGDRIDRVVPCGPPTPVDRFERVWDAEGGALLPGLHDHHIHLASLAASRASVECGPPGVMTADDLLAAIRGVASPGWVRGVGYHESVAGILTREQMDELESARPLRIQHRSGKVWYLNSVAMEALGVYSHELFREDHRLRNSAWQFDLDAGLKDVAQELLAFGIVGVTDATPSNDDRQAERLGRPEINVLAMGGDDLTRGYRKILLDDALPPDLDELIATIRRAHDGDRGVAIHCVTRTELVLALAAIEAAGPLGIDRIEHASVADDATFDLMRRTQVTVVTQPNFVFERGDRYLVDVQKRDLDVLYRLKAFDDAGIPLGGGTDAPFGSADPWLALRAATDRLTRASRPFGLQEAMTPERALALFTTDPLTPGGQPRVIAAGAPADLCLLDRSWSSARARLVAEDVTATFVGGLCRYYRGSTRSRG